MNESTPPAKGSYTRKDSHRCVKAEERTRSHKAGNPTPGINTHGLDRACDKFFDARGFKPSISTILQTRGVVIGVTKWTSRLQQNRDRHALACLPVIAAHDSREAIASEGVGMDSGRPDEAQEGHEAQLDILTTNR